MTTTKTATSILPADAISFYHEHGYYVAKGVLPKELLDECQSVMEAWVDAQADTWASEGRIQDKLEDVDFMHRFNELWLAGDKPSYHRSPRKPLVDLKPKEMFEIVSHDALLDLAQAFLGTEEIVSHGVWNSRPKTPDSSFTDTPWHQDGQYFRDQAHIHIMTIWFPLHHVNESNSCLAVSPDFRDAKLYQNFEYPENGFIGIRRDEAKHLPTLPIEMEPGDALCFPQLTPHRAMPNSSDAMRWSMDMRYVATDKAMSPALDVGMVARSADPSRVTSYDEWLAKWPAAEH